MFLILHKTIVFLAQNDGWFAPSQSLVYLEDLADRHWVRLLTSSVWLREVWAALATLVRLAWHHNRWPSSKRLSLLAGMRFCHLPLRHCPPVAAQMAGCSLLRFLWCMLWWRTSSSERANFFWQLDQRQVKGFSPDKEGTDKRKEIVALEEIQLLGRMSSQQDHKKIER